ncbi:MAG: hypothetical protein V8S57_04895, partial [Oscillospiraceae bacterium]
MVIRISPRATIGIVLPWQIFVVPLGTVPSRPNGNIKQHSARAKGRHAHRAVSHDPDEAAK